MTTRQRGTAARFGLVLLNLLAPGVGLLRAGDKRRALIIYGVYFAAFFVFVAVRTATTTITFAAFAAYAALMVTVLIITVAALALSMRLTWRESSQLTLPRPIWSRWYSIVAAIVFTTALCWFLPSDSARPYHSFYLPAESMEPTLNKGDRFLASMRKPKALHRGDLLMVKAEGGFTYVKRLAALPGDRISLKNGFVFINGQAVAVKPAGGRRVSYPYMPATEARLYLEMFPGEASPHWIQDLGPSAEDDMPELTVAPGHVFMLGDNRDDSADSRVPATMGGLEQVPIENVIGRALFLYWPLDKMGQSLGGPEQDSTMRPI
jgi:signal peptidase I